MEIPDSDESPTSSLHTVPPSPPDAAAAAASENHPVSSPLDNAADSLTTTVSQPLSRSQRQATPAHAPLQDTQAADPAPTAAPAALAPLSPDAPSAPPAINQSNNCQTPAGRSSGNPPPYSQNSSPSSSTPSKPPAALPQRETQGESNITKPVHSADAQAPDATMTAQSPLVSRAAAMEATLADLTTQRDELLRHLRSMPAFQSYLSSDENEVNGNTDEITEAETMDAASKVIKRHIKLLHAYNEIRDAGTGIMGLIAEGRGVRIKEVQEEYGIEAGD